MTRLLVIWAAMALTTAGPVPRDRDASFSLDRLAWMAGRWVGTDGETTMEEVWMAPLGGVMIGMHRDVRAGGGFFFESLIIEETGKEIVYYASPRGRQPPTPFRLTEQGADRAVFSNPHHDFPQTLRYQLTPDGRLHVAAAGEQNGQRVLNSWTWDRADAWSSAHQF